MMTLLAVDVAHHVADHTILVERHGVGAEVLRPFCEPGLLGVRHLLLQRRKRIAAARPLLPRYLGDQRVERERRVAGHGVIDAVFLVDVARLVGGM